MVAKRKIVIDIEDIGRIIIKKDDDYKVNVFSVGRTSPIDPSIHRVRRLEMLEKMMKIVVETIENEINEVKAEMSAAATVEWM